MKKISKKETRLLFKIIGQYLQRYTTIMIVFLATVILLNIGFMIGWYLSPDDVPRSSEIAFYIIEGLLLLISTISLILLLLIKVRKVNAQKMVVLNYMYAAFLIAWGTVAFCFDLSLGFSPLLYLLICTFVAGIFLIDPIFYVIVQGLSLIPVFITVFLNPDLFFGESKYFVENLVLFIAFISLIVIVAFKNYQIIYGEYIVENKLENLSYNDELTGLLNERSYVDFVEQIDKRIDKGEDVKFAVILMDVNNLKVTNDTYGHRFGCSLIVRCGHTLPTLFESSKLFHVGGDEFVAIVMDEDLEQFDETMKRFDEAMLYSLVEFEGKELIFSVARGFHIREDGEHYKDVLQIADKAMYENKKYLKEKYNMKGR